MLWSFAAILALAVLAPFGGYVYVGLQEAQAQEEQTVNPRSEYWREVRRGAEGYTSVANPEGGVLINGEGNNWRQLRNGVVATYTPWLLAVALGGIALMWLFKGAHKPEEPDSGRMVQRWSLWSRVLHWVVATLFIVMAFTGTSLLFGRAVLIPWLGHEGFAAYAAYAISMHNYIGPFFSVGILLMILTWIRDNLPRAADLQWLKRGGGLLGGKQPPSGKFNAGEKLWFWFIAIFGTIACVTGLVLDFPNLVQSRETMQMANLVHGITTMLWISFFLGHVYMGTVGTEGALSGMISGNVSENWARHHHALWYEEVKDQEAPVRKVPTSPQRT